MKSGVLTSLRRLFAKSGSMSEIAILQQLTLRSVRVPPANPTSPVTQKRNYNLLQHFVLIPI